jgi:hypothetical protein
VTPSRKELARDWDLWCEYVNPSGAMSRDEFDAMTEDQRLTFMAACFGDDDEVDE